VYSSSSFLPLPQPQCPSSTHHLIYNHKINRCSRRIEAGRLDRNPTHIPSSPNQTLKLHVMSVSDHLLYPRSYYVVLHLHPFPTAARNWTTMAMTTSAGTKCMGYQLHANGRACHEDLRNCPQEHTHALLRPPHHT
jgi:hypothetical protein